MAWIGIELNLIGFLPLAIGGLPNKKSLNAILCGPKVRVLTHIVRIVGVYGCRRDTDCTGTGLEIGPGSGALLGAACRWSPRPRRVGGAADVTEARSAFLAGERVGVARTSSGRQRGGRVAPALGCQGAPVGAGVQRVGTDSVGPEVERRFLHRLLPEDIFCRCLSGSTGRA